MLRRILHVVRHDVDKVNIGHNAFKIDVIGRAYCCERQKLVASYSLTNVAHHQVVVASVVG